MELFAADGHDAGGCERVTGKSGMRPYDSENEQLRFGGVTMQKYTLATIYLLSLALKHERFASTLVEKAPEIRLRDVLTITSEKSELEGSMIEALIKLEISILTSQYAEI